MRNMIRNYMEEMLEKIRSIDKIPKILIIAAITTVVALFGVDRWDWRINAILFFSYWIFFGWKKKTDE